MNRDLEIVLSLLEEGKSVELPAVGYSMFPTMRAGQRFVVRAVGNEERLVEGSVIVCLAEGRGQRAEGERENTEGERGRMGERERDSYAGVSEEEENMGQDKRQKEKDKRDENKDDDGEIGMWGMRVLVTHRLIKIRKSKSGETLYITKGDSRPEYDEPWRKEQIIGIVTGRKTKSGIKEIRYFVPGKMRFAFNRILIWFYWRIKRLA
jgi:hypothetical protein